MRSTGPGGQSVNTTDSAVRVTHLPTGIVVACQDERSQIQNRERALKILRARLYEQALEERNAAEAAERLSQIGTGERSEKIRTYNYPERRVTDHRIKFTSHNLDAVLAGDLSAFTQASRRTRTASAASRPRATGEHGSRAARALSRVPGAQRRAVAEARRRVPAGSRPGGAAARALPRPRPPARAGRGRPPARARAPARAARAARLRARQLELLRAGVAVRRARARSAARDRGARRALPARCSTGAAEPSVVDVGTGTGAIALALAARLPEASVTAIDLSPERARAGRRERRRSTASPTGWSCSRATCSRPVAGRRFDLVASNPPYVAAGRDGRPRGRRLRAGTRRLRRARRTGHPRAPRRRPRRARCARAATSSSRSAEGQAPWLAEHLAGLGYTAIAVTRDLRGIERVVEAQAPS